MEWENRFESHILDRGYDYYCNELVDNIEFGNGVLMADVYGSQDYEVKIHFDGEKIQKMYCSCPYASDGTPCKHMAAVLYAWDDEDFPKQDKEENDNLTEQLVAEADETVIRRFLTEILQEDERLFSRFKMLAHASVSSEDIKKYKKQIDNITYRYLGRENFISYYDAASFIRELGTFLNEDVRMLLDDKFYLEAFELTNYVFITVSGVDMDDSDGGTGMLAEQCLDIWREILENADTQTERTLYEWFTGHLDGTVIDYMEEYIVQILMESFNSPEYLQAKLDFTEMKSLEADAGSDSWSSAYHASQWALKHIDILEKSKASWNTIESYCRSKWKYSAIRKYYSAKYIEKEDYCKAIDVLKESIRIDADSPGLIRDIRVKLKDIYKLCGRMDEYREELWQLVIKDYAGNLELFQELRDQYSGEEWIDAREKIFSGLPAYANIAQLYKEEKLYDRLLAFVQKSQGMSALQQYTEILAENYPKELLDKYEQELERLARNTANRDRYREWVGVLRRMQRICGGKDRVKEITKHWRLLYGNRPAMMDELRKLQL